MPSPTLQGEKQTVEAMIGIYCRGHHGPEGEGALCSDCEALRDYALSRLGRCPFGEEKPKCSDCHVHCYKPAMRERIREVMKYAGPRMLLRHPVLAIKHVSRRNRPTKP